MHKLFPVFNKGKMPNKKSNKIVAAFRKMHVSPAKHSYVWLPKKCDYRTDTDRRTDGRTDAGQSDPYVPLCFAGDTKSNKIVTAFQEMHVLPVVHSYGMCDYQESLTTRQTDGQTPDKVIPMCHYALQATQKPYSPLQCTCIKHFHLHILTANSHDKF